MASILTKSKIVANPSLCFKRYLAFAKCHQQMVVTRKAHADAVEHHHEEPKTGPQITEDYVPIPRQPYKKVHAELQSKFNMYLAIGSVVLAIALFNAYRVDLFGYRLWCVPESYRNRKAINAKLRAAEQGN